ncbi:uncharacterized protein LOC121862692, partial [Homarus americanus]|uniref:uncharacterized protein LOC121862692 n=1 Tax=Homarus americanus TaxID=6706 RepID=UPI001C439AE6
MATFDVEGFVENPSVEMLKDSVLRKDDGMKLADTYEIEYRRSQRKSEIKNAVLTELVNEEVLPKGALTLRSFDPRETVEIRKLEMEHRRLEREKDKLHELALKEREERERERERQHELALAQVSSRRPDLQALSLVSETKLFDVTKHLRLVPAFDEEDPQEFFMQFEKIAKSFQWPEESCYDSKFGILSGPSTALPLTPALPCQTMMYVTSLLGLFIVLASSGVPRLPRLQDRPLIAAVEDVLASVTDPYCFLVFITDGSTWPIALYKGIHHYHAPWGVGAFEVVVDGQNANVTQAQLSWVVDEARRLRQVSWCVTVVVVSDDPAFLVTFAELSVKGRLLVWSSRLLIVTRPFLLELQGLHKLLSLNNAMLLIMDESSTSRQSTVYIHLPFTTHEAEPLKVAIWTPHRGLTLTTSLPLFPDKFF